MAKWIILGILLFIAAFLLIPHGAHIDYNDGEIKAYLCVFFLKIKLYDSTKPKKEKQKNKKPKSETQVQKPQKKKRKIPFEFIKNCTPAVKMFFKKLRVSKVYIAVAVGGEDAYKTGITYGTLSAVSYPIIGFFHSLKHFKLKRFSLYPDFLSEKTRIKASFRAKMSIVNILRILMIVVYQFTKTANNTNEKEGNDNGKSVNPSNSGNLDEQTSRTR